MKKLIIALIALAIPALANQGVGGFCEQGNTTVQTAGLPSTTTVQGSFPACTVSVFTAGTSTPITIFADNVNTPLSNPFTANSSGRWIFYAANNQRVDIQLSGGGLPSPWKITDVILNDPNGGIIAPSNFNGIRIVDGVRFAQSAAGINAADVDLGTAFGEIWVPPTNLTGIIATDAQISISANHVLRVMGKLNIEANNTKGPILLASGARLTCSVNGSNFGTINENTPSATITSMVRATVQDGSQVFNMVDGCDFSANGATVTNGVIDVTGFTGLSWVRDTYTNNFVSGWGIFAQDVQSGALGGTNDVQIVNNRIAGSGTAGCIAIIHSTTNAVVLGPFNIQDTICVPGSTSTNAVLLQNPAASGPSGLTQVAVQNMLITNAATGTNAFLVNGVRFGSFKNINCQGGAVTNCVNIANNPTNNLGISFDNLECNACSNVFTDASNSFTNSNNFGAHYDYPNPVNSGYSGSYNTIYKATVANFNNIRIVDGVKFAQSAAGINAADADLGSAAGEVWIPSPSVVATDAQISIRAAHTLRVFGSLTIDATAAHGPILLGQGSGMVCAVNGGGGIIQSPVGTITSMVRANAQDGSQNKGFWLEGCLFNANGSTVTLGVIDVTGSVNFGVVRDNEICCAVSGWGIFAQDVQSGALGGTNNVQVLNNRMSGTGTFGCIEITHSVTNSVTLSNIDISDINCAPGASSASSIILQDLSSTASLVRQMFVSNSTVNGTPSGQSSLSVNGVQQATIKGISCLSGTNCVIIATNTNNSNISVDNILTYSANNVFADSATNVTIATPALLHYDFPGVNNGENFLSGVSYFKVQGLTPTSATGTGFGTGPTFAFNTGSTNNSGLIFVTAGTTPTSSGTMTLNFNTTQTNFGINPPPCVFTLENNTGTWNARATAIIQSATNTAEIVNWDNNAVNLTAASIYVFSYWCAAK